MIIGDSVLLGSFLPLSGITFRICFEIHCFFSKLAKLICYAALVSFGDDDHDTCCPGLKRIEIRNARVKINVRAYKKIEQSQRNRILCVQSLDFNSEVCPN